LYGGKYIGKRKRQERRRKEERDYIGILFITVIYEACCFIKKRNLFWLTIHLVRAFLLSVVVQSIT
jgi:hypothetical protein